MLKKLIAGLVFVVLTSTVIGQDPVAPAMVMQATDIAAALDESAAERAAMAVSAISIGDDYRINLIRRTEAAGAIVHEVGTELHFITEGAGTLVTGGIIIRPEGGGPATIDQGLAQRVSAGDAILIPEGTPHWYSAVEGLVTYLEVRF